MIPFDNSSELGGASQSTEGCVESTPKLENERKKQIVGLDLEGRIDSLVNEFYTGDEFNDGGTSHESYDFVKRVCMDYCDRHSCEVQQALPGMVIVSREVLRCQNKSQIGSFSNDPPPTRTSTNSSADGTAAAERHVGCDANDDITQTSDFLNSFSKRFLLVPVEVGGDPSRASRGSAVDYLLASLIAFHDPWLATQLEILELLPSTCMRDAIHFALVPCRITDVTAERLRALVRLWKFIDRNNEKFVVLPLVAIAAINYHRKEIIGQVHSNAVVQIVRRAFTELLTGNNIESAIVDVVRLAAATPHSFAEAIQYYLTSYKYSTTDVLNHLSSAHVCNNDSIQPPQILPTPNATAGVEVSSSTRNHRLSL
eukprot:Lankesteria_metandrocarpae@DN4514_c1_g1_i1.p1